MATTATRINYWIVTTTSTTSSTFNFKFVVEIVVGGSIVATLKQPKNNAGAAHFNIERIVKNYTDVSNKIANTVSGAVSYNSIHLMPRNIPNPSAGSNVDFAISKNTNTLRIVTLRFYEEFSCLVTVCNTNGSIHTAWIWI